jgi:Holliday junction DNA helicase RuvA
MIGRLRGVVAAKRSDAVLLDVAGVGYEVTVTPRALSDLPPLGEEAVLHTHLHVREDQQALFGFDSDSERDVFRALLGASGVGPKLAIAILATLPPGELRAAVAGGDVAALEAVPGVGKRTAQKLVLELRPRLDAGDGDLPGEGAHLSEAREALEALGFAGAEIRDVLRSLPADASTEDLLQQALQELGKQ